MQWKSLVEFIAEPRMRHINWDPNNNINTAFLNRTHWSIPLRYVPHNPIFHEEFRFDVRHPGVLPPRPIEFISRTAAVGGGGEHRNGPGHLLTWGGDIRNRLLKTKETVLPTSKRWVWPLSRLWLVHTSDTYYLYAAEFWKNNTFGFTVCGLH